MGGVDPSRARRRPRRPLGWHRGAGAPTRRVIPRMADPAVTATLDRATYAPGDTMTLTVDYSVPAESRVAAAVTLDVLGASRQATVAAPVMRLTVADPDRAWSQVSDDGATAV